MAASRIISIGCAGLTDNELNALKSVCSISRMATRSFGFEVTSAGADIVVLAGAPGAAAADGMMSHATRGVLWVGEEAPLARDAVRAIVQRPLLAARLLGALDKLVESLGESPAASRKAAAEPAVPLATALVVDDSPTVRKQLEQVLGGMRVDVVVATTGEEALELAQGRHFDLVLLDVQLPGADGYSVCRTLKRDARTREFPVVMLTSKSSPFDKIRGNLAGCDNYLTKPVSKDDFERTVSRFVSSPAGAARSPASLQAA